MALLNPPGYLHNATPAVASGAMDRMIAIVSHVAADGDGLTVLDGVRGYNDFKVSANGTPNMSVNVAAGTAIVKGTQSATQGAYAAFNDGTVNLAISAAHASNPRWDLVVLRIYDSQYSGSTNTSTLEVITGTASATPADPTVPANCLVLARVVVAANDTAIGSGDIADQRQWTSSVGGIIPVLNAGQRDGLTLRPGLAVYRIDTQTLEIYNSTTASWNSESSTSGTSGITGATGWTINSQSWVKKNGFYQFYLTATRTGATINAGATGNMGNVSVATIPSGSRPPHNYAPVVSGATGQMLVGVVSSSGIISVTATVPSNNIETSEQISLSGGYVL